jgi:elongation factor Ts
MAEITAALVKELREKTGVGMMDCKKALAENNGDLEASIDWLRAKGLSKAAKKADRAAAEGLVGVEGSGNQAAVVELNSETDFVARNEQFQKAAAAYAQLALKVGGDLEKLLASPAPGGGTVKDEITGLIATIGENINLRRSAMLSVGQGVVATYIHNAAAPGLGRVGVLVALESAGNADALNDIGRKIAMHVAATSPLSVSIEEIPADAVAREKAILTEQAKESGKPANVIEKMIEGRLRKFYEEVVLTKQAFVLNPDQTVEAAVKEAEKAAGAPIKLTSFVHFRLGEGVEKKVDDFAAEVAATASGGR